MAKQNIDEQLYQRLKSRLEPLHLRQRLGIESDSAHRVFGQGRTHFHIENWYSFKSIISATLHLTMLYERGKRNALNIQVTHNDILVKNLPQAFKDFRILHISDLHLDMNMEFPRVLSERIKDVDHDICVLTGDYCYRTSGPYEPALESMAQVLASTTSPVYGILGNHDSIRMLPAMEDLGIQMLMNESIELKRDDEAIHLAGVDDPHYFNADNLELACRNIPEDRVSILLAHSPEIYRHAAHAGFDIMFCGHTHGGQIALPGGTPIITNAKCPRQVCKGNWTHHQLNGYTSVGAGSTIVDVRFNCPPEITLHTLRHA